MGRPHKGFRKLSTWTAIPFTEAGERFELADGQSDEPPPRGFDLALEDIFGEEPEEVFVHEGSVRCAGDVAIGSSGDYAGVYVIDGDLEVEGLLDFKQVDGGAVLLVTGTLRARSVSVAEEAQLWVGGALEVAEYILAGVSDAGGLAVKGPTTARAIIATDGGTLAFGKKPRARVIERSEGTLDEEAFRKRELAEAALVSPFNTEELDHEALVRAVKKGKPILAG